MCVFDKYKIKDNPSDNTEKKKNDARMAMKYAVYGQLANSLPDNMRQYLVCSISLSNLPHAV